MIENVNLREKFALFHDRWSTKRREALALLFEPKSIVNNGDVFHERTIADLERI